MSKKKFLSFRLEESGKLQGLFVNPDHVSFIEATVSNEENHRVSETTLHMLSGETVRVKYNPFVVMEAMGIDCQVPENLKGDWHPEI